MQITWFGHFCFRIDTGSSRILIDPFLSGNPTFEKAAIPLQKAIDSATHVALTHGHEDHVGDTVQICKETSAMLLAVHELATHLAAQGVEKIDGGNTGGTLYHDDFDLNFVPAWHSASNIVDGRPALSRRLLRAHRCSEGGQEHYHMGDTAIFSDMGLIGEVYAPKVRFVPIGDRYTMGAKTAALACKRFFHFELIVPCHYGTFPVLDQSADRFVAELGGDKVVVPKVGVSFEA